MWFLLVHLHLLKTVKGNTETTRFYPKIRHPSTTLKVTRCRTLPDSAYRGSKFQLRTSYTEHEVSSLEFNTTMQYLSCPICPPLYETQKLQNCFVNHKACSRVWQIQTEGACLSFPFHMLPPRVLIFSRVPTPPFSISKTQPLYMLGERNPENSFSRNDKEVCGASEQKAQCGWPMGIVQNAMQNAGT